MFDQSGDDKPRYCPAPCNVPATFYKFMQITSSTYLAYYPELLMMWAYLLTGVIIDCFIQNLILISLMLCNCCYMCIEVIRLKKIIFDIRQKPAINYLYNVKKILEFKI